MSVDELMAKDEKPPVPDPSTQPAQPGAAQAQPAAPAKK
jgi:hypothetical protein